MSSLLNNIISLTEKQQQQRIVWKQNQKRRVQKKTPTENQENER